MTISLVRQVTAALAEFSSRSRLYELTIGEGNAGLGAGSLLVEAFAACDALQEIGYRDLSFCRPATGSTSLRCWTSRRAFGGEISEVGMLGGATAGYGKTRQ